MKIKQLLLLTVLGLISASCTTQLYSWQNSEEMLCYYQNDHSDRAMDALLHEFDKVVYNQSQDHNTIPPGMMADYGYLLFKSGRKMEAKEYLQKELELYPESQPIVDKILQKMEP